MRILITGGKGFIGTRLVKALANVHSESDSRIPLQHNITTYDLVDGQDIRNMHDLDKAFEYAQPQTVIHLAARTGVRRSIDYPGEYITTNIEGTWNVGAMCQKHGARLISFSTASVFGNEPPPIPEYAEKRPISLYGMTKLIGEHIVDNLSIPTVIVRPFNVYGGNGRGDQVFFKWINQLKTGRLATIYDTPESCRGYTHVADLAEIVAKLAGMEWNWKDHQDFNLGGSEIITLDDLVQIFRDNIADFALHSVRIPAPKEDIVANYACIDKAREIIGFNPPPRFQENLISIIEKELIYA